MLCLPSHKGCVAQEIIESSRSAREPRASATAKRSAREASADDALLCAGDAPLCGCKSWHIAIVSRPASPWAVSGMSSRITRKTLYASIPLRSRRRETCGTSMRTSFVAKDSPAMPPSDRARRAYKREE